MRIRTYQPGDEAAQAAIYNDAAAGLPKFKPATEHEVRRRCQAADFDPQTRFFAEVNDRPVGYAAFHANGRVSYPWCRPGHHDLAEPLFQAVIEAMAKRGHRLALAAYRKDWAAPGEFLLRHGFRQAREMVNFIVDPLDLPTSPDIRRTSLTPVGREDLPSLMGMVERPRISEEELEKAWLGNTYFGADALFALRRQGDDGPVAVGILVTNPEYADARLLDADMPCFRLGAFGTEGMQTKRINGLFSFMTSGPEDANRLALDLAGHAVSVMEAQASAEALAAQAPSDAPRLLQFYERYFQRQGSFPVFERAL